MKSLFYQVLNKGIFKSIFIFVLSTVYFHQTTAQTSLSLEESINIAVQNNLDVKRAMNNAVLAKATERQSKFNYLPTVTAANSYNAYLGTIFDNASGKFVNTTTYQSFTSVVADLILFNGFRNHIELSRTKLEMDATLNDVEQSKLSIKVLVTGLYLQVISNKENLNVSQERIKVLEEQLSRAQKQADAGAINIEQVYNLRSQLATERLNFVNLENQYKANRLSLLLELQLDPNRDYVIEDVSIGGDAISFEVPDYSLIFENATVFSPSIKSAQIRQRSEGLRVRSSQSARLPVVAVTGAYQSMYSSNLRMINSTGETETIPYLEQLNINQSQFLGFRINVPIFNRYQNSLNVYRAKMGMKNAELDYKIAKNALNNDLQRAHQDIVAAKSTYIAASENLLALDQAFKFAEARYNAGAIDFYSYIESLNNKNRAEVERSVAKYTFLFRKRILELYQGN
jgi:outer membrane protein